MGKLALYPRLALTGLWRNRGVYLPYLLACVTSVATLYILLAVRFSDSVASLPGAGTVESFMLLGSWLLMILCGIILWWANGFLFKRRRAELGLYAILGVEKTGMAALQLFETLFVALLALGAGLAVGLLLARLIFLLLLALLEYEVRITLPFSPEAFLFTTMFFLALFGLLLVRNLAGVARTSPLGLLAGARQGQREPRASLLLTLAGLGCLLAGYIIANGDGRPADIIGVFLLAALLVIIGTYCLFLSGSVLVLKLLRRNRGYYYRPRHFVTVSNMIYRMRQNAAGLASICVLSCMVLTTVSATVALYAGRHESVTFSMPYTGRAQVYESGFERADILETAVRAVAAQSGAEVEAFHDYYRTSRLFLVADGQGGFVADTGQGGVNYNLYLMRLEDYNTAAGQSASLQPGEAILYTRGFVWQGGDSLLLNGIRYDLLPAAPLDKIPTGTPDNNYEITLVLPDQAAFDAALAAYEATVQNPALDLSSRVVRRIDFDIAGDAAALAAFDANLHAWWSDTFAADTGLSLALQGDTRDEWLARYGGFLFLGSFFAILFVLAAAMIVYYKQISEGYDDRERYRVLQQVGMSGDEVRRTIRSQVGTMFFLPLGVAVVHILMAFAAVRKGLVAFGVVNQWHLVAAGLGAIALYALVYLLIYLRTAKTYYKIVRHETAA